MILQMLMLLDVELQVLLPAIGELLRRPEWETWSSNLHLFSYHEGMKDVAVEMSKFSPWASRMIEKKEAKLQLLQEKGIDNATYWKMKKAEWKSKQQGASTDATQPERRSLFNMVWQWITNKQT